MYTANTTLVPSINWNNLTTSRVVVDCDTTTAGITITLPSIADIPGRLVEIVVIDATGAASIAKPITIVPWSDDDSSDQINNQDAEAPVVLTTANASCTLRISADGIWSAEENNTQTAAQAAQRVYKAILTQTSTSAPVATVLYKNTPSTFIPVFGYTSAGVYTMTLTGAFKATVGLSITSTSSANNYGIARTSDNVITITTAIADGTPTNALLAATQIVIEFNE